MLEMIKGMRSRKYLGSWNSVIAVLDSIAREGLSQKMKGEKGVRHLDIREKSISILKSPKPGAYVRNIRKSVVRVV